MLNRTSLRRVDADIVDTTTTLFPGAELTLGRRAVGRASFRLVPGLRRTHLLVPADAPAAAGKAVDRRSAKDTLRQVLLRRGVEAVLRTPAMARTFMPHVLQVGPSEDSLLDYLEGVVGTNLRVSLAIGARRANRKPVLSVHTAEGTEVGYAKVGLTALANSLIDHEAKTLLVLAQAPVPKHFTAPNVIHHGTWAGSQVLLMESLRPSSQRTSQGVPVTAMAELASRAGITWESLAGSSWLGAIRAEGRRLAAAGEPGLADVTARYEEAFSAVRVPLGMWHGDLGPWNMAWEGDIPLIWDWERAQQGVPVGIDAVHFTCHSTLRDIGNLDGARAVLVGEGSQVLSTVHAALGHDGSGNRLRNAVLCGYLLSLAARFSVDADRPDGDAVRAIARWHVTVLDDQLARRSLLWN